MKNEKFCFSKGTGLIALVGILLIGAVFVMNLMTSNQQTTGAKAFLQCPNSSLADVTGYCPNAWIARDANGNAFTSTTKDVWGNPAKCCYLNTNYSGECPNGSSPDPNSLCLKSQVLPGKFVTRKSDNKQIQCCNFIDIYSENNSPIQGVPAPELTQAALPTIAQNTINTNSPYILQDEKYCKALGLVQVPTTTANGYTVPQKFVNDYYTMYCKKNENNPKWNGTYGKGAVCYTATGVCAITSTCASTSCLRGISADEKCLNIPVAFKKCVDAGKAPTQADPATPDNKRCTGTCASNVAIGKCAPGYARRCSCTFATTGLLYPKYVDDVQCAPPAKTCLNQVSEWIKQGTKTCGGYAAYNVCTKDKFRCICDAVGKWTYPTLQKDESCGS